MRDVKSQRLQCDEIWSFCYAKAKNGTAAKSPVEGAGDVWKWAALDADTKLMVSYFSGDRSGESARRPKAAVGKRGPRGAYKKRQPAA